MSQPPPTADELLLARAEANGYQRGVHRESDEVRNREKHVTTTKRNQDGTLRRYILWHLGAMRKGAAQNGLPPPDEETVRREHLRAGAAAPDLATVKDFLRFYIATSRPRLDANRPTVDSVNIVAEWFFAGFTRVTGTDTDEDERSEVYNWVRRTLTLEGIVVNKHRPKHNFTMRDLTRVLLTLWTRDDLIFIPERYRVQTTFIIHVYCWTGARIGAFFTDGLRYKDIELVLQRVHGRRWRLIYKIDQRWVKNNRDPENIVFGAAAKENEKLFYNDAGFLLAMAVADDALFGYESLEDVRKQEIPEGEDELVLRFKDSALDRPILRQCTKTGGVADDPMPKSSFTSILKSTLTNAGYLCGPSIHAIRRQLGKGVDKRHTAVQRSQHLTQADPRVFGQSYVANCSSVDGQAAFRDEESDQRHIEYFQSLEKFHEEGLPDRLPAHLEQKILRDPQLCEVDRQAQALKQTADYPGALNKVRQRYTNLLKKLKLAALRQYQQNWVRERRDWKILTRGRQVAQDKSKTDFVQNICLLVPERGRLAQQMAADHPLKPDNMWQALQDLHTLCTQDFTVLYLPRSRPVDAACPVKCCQMQLESLPKSQRNHHIQSCVRWDMAHRLNHLHSEVHYCHQCFDWVVGEEWEPHCRSHLVEMTTKRCGTITYCHTLVRPGYCPFCMGDLDPTVPASRRLESWTRDHKLWNHVQEHLGQCSWPRACPHPLCDTAFPDADAMQFHFIDEHGFSRARPGQSGSPTAPDSEDEGVLCDEATRGGRSSQKRKLSSPTGTLEWMASESFNDMPRVRKERPICRPAKRRRVTPTTTQPAALILDSDMSDDQSSATLVDSVSLSPPLSQLGTEWDDDRSNFEAGLPPSHRTTVEDEYDLREPEHWERDSELDVLFDQYIRSPSPSIVPDDQVSDLSGAILTDSVHNPCPGRTEALKWSGIALKDEAAPGREVQSSSNKVPSIRLRVREPKITLSLKLPQRAKAEIIKSRRDSSNSHRGAKSRYRGSKKNGKRR